VQDTQTHSRESSVIVGRPVERQGMREKSSESVNNTGDKNNRILTAEPGQRRKLVNSSSVNNINTTVSINQNLQNNRNNGRPTNLPTEENMQPKKTPP
jgi:hypothetical protein